MTCPRPSGQVEAAQRSSEAPITSSAPPR